MAKEQIFPDHKPFLFLKLYLIQCVFVVFGTIIFIVLLLLDKLGFTFSKNSPLAIPTFIFLKIWLVAFAYVLPIGIINLGLWGIIFKESGIKISQYGYYRTPLPLKGGAATVMGVIYLVLGVVLLWGITGVLLGFCESRVCLLLPKIIKFF